MNPTSVPSLAVEVPEYVALQREIHDALRAQHPEWILPNGDCPTGDFYDARFAELLIQSLPTGPRGPKQGNTHQPFENCPRVREDRVRPAKGLPRSFSGSSCGESCLFCSPTGNDNVI